MQLHTKWCIIIIDIMASTTIIIKFVLLYFIQSSLGNALPQPVIVEIAGGHAVDIVDAPYMASLLVIRNNAEEMMCGGSIVHERFVLTAAHCIMFRMQKPFVVRVGSSQLLEGRLYEVEKYIRHEFFGGWNANYDVGLLKLTEPVTFGPTVAKLQLADESFNITTGLNANVTGWGMTVRTFESSHQLQQLTVTVSDPEFCDNPFLDTEMLICITTFNFTHGFCHGDSGGPLSVGDVQIGIVSNGPACYGMSNKYVKVAPHVQWIQEEIKRHL